MGHVSESCHVSSETGMGRKIMKYATLKTVKIHNHFLAIILLLKVDIKLMKTKDKLKEWRPAGRTTETTH